MQRSTPRPWSGKKQETHTSARLERTVGRQDSRVDGGGSTVEKKVDARPQLGPSQIGWRRAESAAQTAAEAVVFDPVVIIDILVVSIVPIFGQPIPLPHSRPVQQSALLADESGRIDAPGAGEGRGRPCAGRR